MAGEQVRRLRRAGRRWSRRFGSAFLGFSLVVVGAVVGAAAGRGVAVEASPVPLASAEEPVLTAAAPAADQRVDAVPIADAAPERPAARATRHREVSRPVPAERAEGRGIVFFGGPGFPLTRVDCGSGQGAPSPGGDFAAVRVDGFPADCRVWAGAASVDARVTASRTLHCDAAEGAPRCL